MDSSLSVLDAMAVLWAIGTMLETSTMPRRIALLCALLMGWITLNMFSARLASSITVEKHRPIRGFADLFNQGYDVYVESGASTLTILRDAAPGTYQRMIWDQQVGYICCFFTLNYFDILYQISTDSKFTPTDLETLRTSMFNSLRPTAFFTYYDMWYTWAYEIPLQICQSRAIKTPERNLGAFAINKQFPYRQVFNYRLNKMMENGMIDILYKRLVTAWYWCPDPLMPLFPSQMVSINQGHLRFSCTRLRSSQYIECQAFLLHLDRSRSYSWLAFAIGKSCLCIFAPTITLLYVSWRYKCIFFLSNYMAS